MPGGKEPNIRPKRCSQAAKGLGFLSLAVRMRAGLLWARSAARAALHCVLCVCDTKAPWFAHACAGHMGRMEKATGRSFKAVCISRPAPGTDSMCRCGGGTVTTHSDSGSDALLPVHANLAAVAGVPWFPDRRVISVSMGSPYKNMTVRNRALSTPLSTPHYDLVISVAVYNSESARSLCRARTVNVCRVCA